MIVKMSETTDAQMSDGKRQMMRSITKKQLQSAHNVVIWLKFPW